MRRNPARKVPPRCATKRQRIHDYFVKEWGYDLKFAAAGIKYIESTLGGLSIKELARTMAEFASENPDCNFNMMSQEILGFLRNIVEVDGEGPRPDRNIGPKLGGATGIGGQGCKSSGPAHDTVNVGDARCVQRQIAGSVHGAV